MPSKPQCFLVDLVRAVARIAPPELAADWDNVGLQVGHPAAPLRRAMTCLEVTAQTLDEAKARGADAIVAHHPLIFRPLSALNLAQPATALVAELIRSGIALVAAHTNLDSAAWSTNTVLAEACGFAAEGPLAPREGTDDGTGFGLLVKLPKPLPIDQLAANIKKGLGLATIRLSGPPEKKVKRLAICTGSGGSYIGLAAVRADAYLTGEINYHHGVEAMQRGIAVIEIGHFESEAIVARPLAARLAEDIALKAAGVEVFATAGDFQPFRDG